MIMSALCLTNTLNWILLCRLTETTVYRLDMSVPITTDVVVLTLHYVIKFVSDLGQVGGFLRLPPPIKLTATINLKYC